LESARLPQVIFTPSTKEEKGHDLNISLDQAAGAIGREAAEKIRDASIRIYEKAADYAKSRGIIIADTKFEFGIFEGKLILIDEVLTPDSSRFWPSDGYIPGRPQPSFDKQFVRDYLEGLDWSKAPPAPKLPDEIIEKTREKYLAAYRNLSGKELE
jgi:phosphoribosylaminoimidazole-succinocarboxamide synthase